MEAKISFSFDSRWCPAQPICIIYPLRRPKLHNGRIKNKTLEKCNWENNK